MYHLKINTYVIQMTHQKIKNSIIISMEHCLFAMLDQSKKTQLNEIFYATV